MSVITFTELKNHVGHNVELVVYGKKKTASEICLKCNNCREVIMTYTPQDFKKIK